MERRPRSKRGSALDLSTNSKITPMEKNMHNPSGNVEGGRWARVAVRHCVEENDKSERVEEDERVTSVRNLEFSAYVGVVRAFIAQSQYLTWTKEGILCDLRTSLGISMPQHRELTREICSGTRQAQAFERNTSKVLSRDVTWDGGPSGSQAPQVNLQLQSSSCLGPRTQMLRAADKRPYNAEDEDYDPESDRVKRRTSTKMKNLPRKAQENSFQKPTKSDSSQAKRYANRNNAAPVFTLMVPDVDTFLKEADNVEDISDTERLESMKLKADSIVSALEHALFQVDESLVGE